MADWMEELERLAELRDKGLITDEEYEAERAKIVPSPASTFSEQKQEPDIKSESPPSRLTENKRVKWTKLNKVFLIIWSSLYAVVGPFLEWYSREYPQYSKPRLTFADVFDTDYSEDSIWGGALLVDFFFGGIFYLAVGSILVSIWRKLRN